MPIDCGLLVEAFDSLTGFFYTFFGLSESYSGVPFAVFAKAYARCYGYAYVEEFAGKFYGVSFAVDPDIEGCFWGLAGVSDFI